MGTYNSPRVTATRRRIRTLLKKGVSSIREMERRSGLLPARLHHHLNKMVEEFGIVVKIGDQYYLKRTVLQNRRRFEQGLRTYREKILDYNVKRRFNASRLWTHVRRWNRQRRQLTDLGITVNVTLGPLDIVRAKREHTIRSLEQPRSMSRNVGRKFEHLYEYRRLCRWVEHVYGIDVPRDLKNLPIRNPDLRSRVEKSLVA